MTKTEQAALAYELSNSMAHAVVDKIGRGYVPSSFDGHELRRMLLDEAMIMAGRSEISRYPRSRRAREYRNWRSTTPS